MNFITPSCQHKTGNAVKSVVFSLSHTHTKGLKPHIPEDLLVFIHTSLLTLNASYFLLFTTLPTLFHFLFSLLTLPFSISVCPLLIIVLFLHPSFSLCLSVHGWVEMLRELFDDYLLPLEVNGPYGFYQPVRWSVCVCVDLWLLGDGDEMEIKGCGWVRFKPIYCRSVHSSSSRGKP